MYLNSGLKRIFEHMILALSYESYLSSRAVFSLFISTTGKRVFQTGRALVGISPNYVCLSALLKK